MLFSSSSLSFFHEVTFILNYFRASSFLFILLYYLDRYNSYALFRSIAVSSKVHTFIVNVSTLQSYYRSTMTEEALYDSLGRLGIAGRE